MKVKRKSSCFHLYDLRSWKRPRAPAHSLAARTAPALDPAPSRRTRHRGDMGSTTLCPGTAGDLGMVPTAELTLAPREGATAQPDLDPPAPGAGNSPAWAAGAAWEAPQQGSGTRPW